VQQAYIKKLKKFEKVHACKSMGSAFHLAPDVPGAAEYHTLNGVVGVCCQLCHINAKMEVPPIPYIEQ
jgi:hypothetical protein